MAAELPREKQLLLKSSDGEIFEVDKTVAMQSQIIRYMVETGRTESVAVIPIPDVDAAVLSKVLCYCNRHVKASPTDAEELKNFDRDLVNANYATLVDLIFAAHYMDVRELMDLSCQAMADAIEEQCCEELRRHFYSEDQLMSKFMDVD